MGKEFKTKNYDVKNEFAKPSESYFSFHLSSIGTSGMLSTEFIAMIVSLKTA